MVYFRGKHEVYDHMLTGTPVDFRLPAVRKYLLPLQRSH